MISDMVENMSSTVYGHVRFSLCAPNIYAVYAKVSIGVLTTSGNTYESLGRMLYVMVSAWSVLKSNTKVTSVTVMASVTSGYSGVRSCSICLLVLLWFTWCLWCG